MKYFRILFYISIVFVITSCVISISKGTDTKIKQKKIDGKNYSFIAEMIRKRYNILVYKKNEYKGLISFVGLDDKPIREKITFNDFERKAEIKLPENIRVDSISFTMNDRKDEVKLLFYMSENIIPIKVSFDLVYDDGEWVLMK